MQNKYLQLFLISLFIAIFAVSCKDNTTDPKPQGEDWEARLDFVLGQDSTYLSKSLDAVDSAQRGAFQRVMVTFRESYPSTGYLSVVIVNPDQDTVYLRQSSRPDSLRANTKTVQFVSFQSKHLGAFTGYLVLHGTESSPKLLHTRKLVYYQ